MKFTVAAVLATATGAAAWGSNVTVTTEVVDVYTTYCPAATHLTIGTQTFTVTAPTTLTVTDCSCTITRPVITSSIVACTTCGVPPPVNATGTFATVYPTTAPGGGVPTTVPHGGSVPAGTTVPGTAVPTSTPTAVPTAGAGKVAALSGAGLAGLVGLAAFVL